MAFIEIRFPEDVGYGTVGGATYKTIIATQYSGAESRAKSWQYPLQKYNIVYEVKSITAINILNNFFNATGGRFSGFRFKDFNDFSSSPDGFSAPQENDQEILTYPNLTRADGIADRYQVIKQYTIGNVSQIRIIKKIVIPNQLLYPIINGSREDSIETVIDANTGILTFPADDPRIITNITKANPCVITMSTSAQFLPNTLFIKNVVGMAELNNGRFRVINKAGNQLTLSLDSSAFNAYISDGNINTLPQPGEIVTTGYLFDVPVRFDTDQLLISRDSFNTASITTLPLAEIR